MLIPEPRYDTDSQESPIKKVGFGLGFAQKISQDSLLSSWWFSCSFWLLCGIFLGENLRYSYSLGQISCILHHGWLLLSFGIESYGVHSWSHFDPFLPWQSSWLLHRKIFTLHLLGWLTFGLRNLSGSHPANQEVTSFGRFLVGVIKISSRLKAVTSKLWQVCFKIVLHFAREI